MVCSLIFWGASTPSKSIGYTDSLFLVVAAMTLAGLNTINLSELNTFQQFILFLLTLLGSAIWVSIAVVHVRRKAFERKFTSIVEAERQRRRERSSSRGPLSFSKSFSSSRPDNDTALVRGRPIKTEDRPSTEKTDGVLRNAEDKANTDSSKKSAQCHAVEPEVNREDPEAGTETTGKPLPERHLSIDTSVTRRITFASPSSPLKERENGRRILSMQGVGARQNISNHPLRTPMPIYSQEFPRLYEVAADDKAVPSHRFLSGGFVGRNSQFAGLTLAEREHLGGVEYRALCVLAVLVPTYFVLWQLLGCIGLGAYVAYNRSGAAEENAENPW